VGWQGAEIKGGCCVYVNWVMQQTVGAVGLCMVCIDRGGINEMGVVDGCRLCCGECVRRCGCCRHGWRYMGGGCGVAGCGRTAWLLSGANAFFDEVQLINHGKGSIIKMGLLLV